MDLASIRSIGSAYGERLREAGVATVADLAWIEDLASLSEQTGVPPARLAEFRVAAVRTLTRSLRSGSTRSRSGSARDRS